MKNFFKNSTADYFSLDQLSKTPITKKYEHLFSALDLKGFPKFNTGIGADGTSQTLP